ncbi:MAG: prephenate dehydratase [Pseudomonadota bacterium]
MTGVIAFQGEKGAYSHLACAKYFPNCKVSPCATFEDAFDAIETAKADFGLIPIENSLAGRVADIHHLLPESGLHIIGERFLPIRHQLLARKGADPRGLKTAHSHAMALGQCRRVVRELGLLPVVEADTAGSARRLADSGAETEAAIASELAAEIYGLDIVRANIEDAGHNTTRFVVMSRTPGAPPPPDADAVTSFIFRVRNIPAALYKAMGGFATNGVNMTKLESYQLNGAFTATQFYAEVEGRPEDVSVRLALEELGFFTSHMRILGVYAADPYRKKGEAD